MITENGQKLCDAVTNTILDGEKLIYNQGVVDGIMKLKEVLDDPAVTIETVRQAIDIFLETNTEDGMAKEQTYEAPLEKEAPAESETIETDANND